MAQNFNQNPNAALNRYVWQFIPGIMASTCNLVIQERFTMDYGELQ